MPSTATRSVRGTAGLPVSHASRGASRRRLVDVLANAASPPAKSRSWMRPRKVMRPSWVSPVLELDSMKSPKRRSSLRLSTALATPKVRLSNPTASRSRATSGVMRLLPLGWPTLRWSPTATARTVR